RAETVNLTTEGSSIRIWSENSRNKLSASSRKLLKMAALWSDFEMSVVDDGETILMVTPRLGGKNDN
ncbi:MAG: hypothetical protein ACREB6_05475, partial [Rhodospirillales bacterium]